MNAMLKPSQDAKPHWLILNAGIKVKMPGVPTEDFELVDIDGTGMIRNREIDLSGVDQRVLLMFAVVDTPDLRFPENPDECIGLHPNDLGCPQQPADATKGMFTREGVSSDGRQLAVLNQNRGPVKRYQFALFLVNRSDGQLAAVCDPVIVNK